MFSEPCVSFICPSIGSVCASPFPPRGPLERRPPAFSVLRRAPTSDRPSRLASFPSLGGTSSVSGDGRISPLPGGPPCERAPVCDSRGASAPGIAALRCGLPCGKRRRLPRRVPFRGSITRPTHSLCTLRSRGHPRTTQHSVPAGCQPLPGRSAYLLGSIERFQLHILLLSQALPGALPAETNTPPRPPDVVKPLAAVAVVPAETNTP